MPRKTRFGKPEGCEFFIRTFELRSKVLSFEKTQINLTYVEFYRDSVEEMQAFLYIRCSKIWFFAHLFVPLQPKINKVLCLRIYQIG